MRRGFRSVLLAVTAAAVATTMIVPGRYCQGEDARSGLRLEAPIRQPRLSRHLRSGLAPSRRESSQREHCVAQDDSTGEARCGVIVRIWALMIVTRVPAPPTSSAVTSERWPVQCFFRRKTFGSQDVITIELPAFEMQAPSERETTLSPFNDTISTTPVLVTGRGSRRRARFTREEDDLLVELKEQSARKISWREIERHFPNRTISSLQVHYSTQLKGRRLSKGRALRP